MDLSLKNLRMADGSAAYVHVNWMTPDAFPSHGDVTFVVTGTEGQIFIDVTKNTVTLYNHKRKPHKVALVEPENDCVMDALLYFTNREHKPLLTSADAVNATEAALAAQALAWDRI